MMKRAIVFVIALLFLVDGYGTPPTLRLLYEKPALQRDTSFLKASLRSILLELNEADSALYGEVFEILLNAGLDPADLAPFLGDPDPEVARQAKAFHAQNEKQREAKRSAADAYSALPGTWNESTKRAYSAWSNGASYDGSVEDIDFSAIFGRASPAPAELERILNSLHTVSRLRTNSAFGTALQAVIVSPATHDTAKRMALNIAGMALDEPQMTEVARDVMRSDASRDAKWIAASSLSKISQDKSIIQALEPLLTSDETDKRMLALNLLRQFEAKRGGAYPMQPSDVHLRTEHPEKLVTPLVHLIDAEHDPAVAKEAIGFALDLLVGESLIDASRPEAVSGQLATLTTSVQKRISRQPSDIDADWVKGKLERAPRVAKQLGLQKSVMCRGRDMIRGLSSLLGGQ